MFDGVARAVGAAGLLVGEEGEDDVTLRFAAGSGEITQDRKDHGIHILHVHRAAAPDHAVADLSAERVDLPVVGLGGYDVEVAVQQDRVTLRGAPPRDHVRASGLGLPELRGDADLLEQRGGVHRGLALPRAR